MPIRMVVTKPCTYGTRRLRAGDEFDARGHTDVKLYTALGWATTKPPEDDDTPPVIGERSSDDPRPAPARKTVAAKKTTKRPYIRRNLTAG